MITYEQLRLSLRKFLDKHRWGILERFIHQQEKKDKLLEFYRNNSTLSWYDREALKQIKVLEEELNL